MSEQDGAQSLTKQRRKRKTNTTNQENSKQTPDAQHPTKEDTEAWKAHWKKQGQPWRTEPEIDAERQNYLAKRQIIMPDVKQGIYPFRDIKLSRADVEWLLATHENGRGPVDWSDEKQRERKGLDLRGADLHYEDLSVLPLTRMRSGLTLEEWFSATKEQRSMAIVCLEEANLGGAQLQDAELRAARLQKADLRGAQLQGANLTKAQLQGAYFYEAQLQGAYLYEAQLQGAFFPRAKLQGAYFNAATFDTITAFIDVTLSDDTYGAVSVVDVNWGGVNLARMDWTLIKVLGDEKTARQNKHNFSKEGQVSDYQRAVRANRQLAVVLRDQGLNEEADFFAYRAQMLQRVVWRWKRKFAKYLFSGFLDLLAGYGYKPIRSVIWYLVVIFGFAMAYYIFGHLPLFPDTFVFSLTSFHGRGFFPSLGNETSLHNPLVVLAAFEAIIGLLIEISFIATFTQRFFGK